MRVIQVSTARRWAVVPVNSRINHYENGTVVVGFPCVSQWWYTPIEVYDDIADSVDRLVDGDADKTRLQVYRRGDDWYCTFNVEYDADTSGKTPIGVDTEGTRNLNIPFGESSSFSAGRMSIFQTRHGKLFS